MTNEERNEILLTIRDAFKDAYGFRPNGIDFASMSDEVLEVEYNKIIDDVVESIDREAAEKRQATFFWKGRIKGMMITHNIDLATAIRWDIAAEDARNGDVVDVGYYCYLVGIGYRWSKKIGNILKKSGFSNFVAS